MDNQQSKNINHSSFEIEIVNGKWICDLCNCVQESKEELFNHRILHLSSGKHSKECPLCKKVFLSSAALRNHLTVHTGIKKFRCKYCSRKFGWKTQLATHENVHTGKGLHQCVVCEKSFMTKWLLHRHTKIHDKTTGKNRKRRKYQDHLLKSNVGSKECVSAGVADQCLQATYSEDNNSQNTSLTCYECLEKFSSGEKLAYHLLSHNTSKQSMSHGQKALPPRLTDDQIIPKSLVHSSVVTEVEKGKSGNSRHFVKGSLTSIVSKLHHKVDEQQKQEVNFQDHINVSAEINSTVVDTTSRECITNDFNIDVMSKQAMAKSSDPFISGINTEYELSHEAAFITLKATNDESIHQNFPCNDKFSSVLHTQIQKQTDQICMLREELMNIRLLYEKEFSSLHNKIDCLTNLVSSQALLLNKSLVGDTKTVVDDFTVHRNNTGNIT